MELFSQHNKTKTWPTNTNIACWWCCHQFNTQPIAIPTKLENNIFHVYGCFCSYNCAMSYIFNNNNTNSWEEFTLLKLLYKKINNSNELLTCAPPKEILQMFGGTVTIEEYRQSFKTNTISYRYITPPMISIISQIIEEKNNINQKLNKQSHNKPNILQISKTYKLQRNKSLVNTKNSLESTMGIRIK